MPEISSRHIIYHHPHPVVSNSAEGSQVRPIKMLQAFQQLGFQVEEVTGYAPERQRKMERVIDLIRDGIRFDFAYSESINKPMLLAERMHIVEPEYTNTIYLKWLLKGNPFMDFNFLRGIKQKGVPIGWYCRDILWRFDFYHERRPFFQRNFHILLYQYDWYRYKKLATHLFLPDIAMKKRIPVAWEDEFVSPLPPGAILQKLSPRNYDHNPLRLFYVGGIVPPTYNLMMGINALRGLENIQLTLCCRPHEWQKWGQHYNPPENVDVVHGNSSDLDQYYQAADLFYMPLVPFEYLQHTISIKVFEALGYGVPLITLHDSVVADFIIQHDVGWVAETGEELQALLQHLEANRHEIAKKRTNVIKVRQEHTWQVRAKTVAEKLTV